MKLYRNKFDFIETKQKEVIENIDEMKKTYEELIFNKQESDNNE